MENINEVSEVKDVMPVSISDDNVATIQVSANMNEAEPYRRMFLEEKRKNITLRGFRKGNAPLEMISLQFNHEAIEFAKKNLIYAKYYKILQDHKLRALSEPDLDNLTDKDNEIGAVIKVEVLQPIALGQYLGLEIQKMPERSLDTGTQQALEEIKRIYPKLMPVDSSVGSTSLVNIDFNMLIDGEELENQKSFRVAFGRKEVFAGFEDALMGLNKGDNKSFDLTFPATYETEMLRGRLATFNVKINEVYEATEHTDDELALVLKYENKEHMMTKLTEQVANTYKDDERLFYENQVLGQLLTAHQFNIPKRLLNSEEARILAEHKDMKPEEIKSMAERFVRTDIILSAVYDRHPDLALTQQDFDCRVDELAKKAGDTKENIISKLQETNKLQMYINYLKNCRMVDYIIEQAEKKEMVGVESVLPEAVKEDDKIRGIPKDVVMFDEVQDFDNKEITKVEEK